MANLKDWLNEKFTDWEKEQGQRQSYYAFARYLEVSQSALAQWMMGSSVPTGEDLLSIASKLGPEVYDALGAPRPTAESQRLTVTFANLPPDLRQNLLHAVVEADRAIRQERLRPDTPEARQMVLAVLAKWGFEYTK